MSRTLRSWLFFSLTFLLGLFFTFLMVQITLPYMSGRYDVDFLLTKQNVYSVRIWRYSFYTHIVCSIPVLFIGFLQLSERLRLYSTVLHRSLGKIYVFVVLALSAPSGLVMACYANGGLPARISFVLLSLLWWYFTYRAYSTVRRGEFEKHRHFMYRSFALTLSAITLRAYVLLIPKLFLIRGLDLYILVAWLSWVPNLLVAETIIRTRIQRLARVAGNHKTTGG